MRSAMDARLTPVVVLVWSVLSCCGWVCLTCVLRRCSPETLTVLLLKTLAMTCIQERKVFSDGFHVDIAKRHKITFSLFSLSFPVQFMASRGSLLL
jgi:hypothetical protein